MAPSPRPIFAGFMLPILLIGLASLCLRWQDMRWQDMRWQAAAVAVFLACTGVAALCARYLSQVRMTRAVAVGLAAANTVLVAVGSLAVAPGTTDSFAYWGRHGRRDRRRRDLLPPGAGIRSHRPGRRPGRPDRRPAGDRQRLFPRACGWPS
jgi:hypothetical protein